MLEGTESIIDRGGYIFSVYIVDTKYTTLFSDSRFPSLIPLCLCLHLFSSIPFLAIFWLLFSENRFDSRSY